jgi:cell division protein ZapE
VHFHEFMREIHARLRKLSGEQDPMNEVADSIAAELRLLCFDEFHVSDIADAMILGRLLELLIERGVVIVLTSNYKPDDLYPNGLQRERFLPAIQVINENLDVRNLGGGTDHRRRLLEELKVYYCPIDSHADENLVRFFDAMTKATFNENGTIEVGGRPLAFRRRAKGVIWFDFTELFVKPRSQVDFLEIASAYHTVLISGVQQMKAEKTDVIRRFTWLVDVFYDQRVKLVLSAEVPAEELVAPVTEQTGAQKMVRTEFARTASRLREMQSKDYFSRKHASATNPQVMQTKA